MKENIRIAVDIKQIKQSVQQNSTFYTVILMTVIVSSLTGSWKHGHACLEQHGAHRVARVISQARVQSN